MSSPKRPQLINQCIHRPSESRPMVVYLSNSASPETVLLDDSLAQVITVTTDPGVFPSLKPPLVKAHKKRVVDPRERRLCARLTSKTFPSSKCVA